MSRLHRAARMGKYEEAANCLAEGMDKNALGVHHFSALMLAAREGHLPIVKLLLEAGADVGLTHPNQRTALHFAAGNGHLEVVQALVAYGADVNALSSRGEPPAIEAAHFNHHEVVFFLLEHGADASLKDRQEGMTAGQWLEVGGVPGLFKRDFPDKFWMSPEHSQKAAKEVRGFMAEGLSAEEFAARQGRRILVWSYGTYKFEDADVERWAKRVADTLFTEGLLDQCEERFLQGAELEEARQCRECRAKSAARDVARQERKSQVRPD